MRKSKREAAVTRQRIIKAAAEEFRKNGIAGTGLSDLMAAAGLTHGGFYRHFDSKDQNCRRSVYRCRGIFGRATRCFWFQKIASARIEGDCGKIPFCCAQGRARRRLSGCRAGQRDGPR